MNRYNRLLTMLGHTLYIKNEIKINKQKISNEEEDEKKNLLKKDLKKKELIERMNIIIKIIYLIITLIQPIYTLLIDKIEIETIIKLLFQITPFINYILSIIFFSNDLLLNIETNILLRGEESYKIKYKIKRDKEIIIRLPNDKEKTLIIYIISIVWSIINIILYNLRENIVYRRVIFYIIFIIYEIITRIIITNNTIIFYYIIMKHLFDMDNMVKSIGNKREWTEGSNRIAMISSDIRDLKYELKMSNDSLEYFYIFNTLFILLAFTLIYQVQRFDYENIGDTIIYSIYQCAYLIVIYKINNFIDNVQNIIREPTFMITYLDRNHILNKKSIELGDNIVYNSMNDEVIINMDMNNNENALDNNILRNIQFETSKNSSSIDWLVLDNMLRHEWTDFKFFGIKANGIRGLINLFTLYLLSITIVNYFINDFKIIIKNN